MLSGVFPVASRRLHHDILPKTRQSSDSPKFRPSVYVPTDTVLPLRNGVRRRCPGALMPADADVGRWHLLYTRMFNQLELGRSIRNTNENIARIAALPGLVLSRSPSPFRFALFVLSTLLAQPQSLLVSPRYWSALQRRHYHLRPVTLRLILNQIIDVRLLSYGCISEICALQSAVQPSGYSEGCSQVLNLSQGCICLPSAPDASETCRAVDHSDNICAPVI